MAQTEIVERDLKYQGWMTFSVVSVRTAKGALARREVVGHGRAACVLAYDETRKTAMLVRQLRVPVFVATHEEHLLEAICGMVDDGKAAETAEREAMEEAGLRLRTLDLVAEVWSSPGILIERVSLFLATYGHDDRVGEGGGLADEHEDIEVIEMPLHALADLADRGGLVDMKTLVLLQTLRVRRPDLFGAGP